jgi:hypothetical protein
MISAAIVWPMALWGEISPYPTVVMVTIAQ